MNKRALVLLVADDEKISRALAILINDWGYGLVSRLPKESAHDAAHLLSGVAAIVIDLVKTQPWPAWLKGCQLPTLVIVQSEATSADGLGWDHATMLAKPASPQHIKAWLNQVVGPAGCC